MEGVWKDEIIKWSKLASSHSHEHQSGFWQPGDAPKMHWTNYKCITSWFLNKLFLVCCDNFGQCITFSVLLKSFKLKHPSFEYLRKTWIFPTKKTEICFKQNLRWFFFSLSVQSSFYRFFLSANNNEWNEPQKIGFVEVFTVGSKNISTLERMT